ncbi:zinc finger (c3hc4 ring finger) [Stylonychia lemnae]|uniref:Zinc finger (C3hc4 ring finger) n=1 Tax=Stylonychia lemnae TaxID=5949 RepID=A0A078AP14_STYLE|nr:zinc finger (c3hc4 ring finger) [Stylonychia lemnae]|eukprot:CDW83057.1 zinc finger (c3hc4 ring finger) [Stylonychia lemnae]
MESTQKTKNLDKDDKFQVEAVVSQDKETGEVLFNGMSNQQITAFQYQCNNKGINLSELNYYQMACKPRLLVDTKDEDESDEDDYIDINLFHQIKEVLLCPVCFDVFKQPDNVRPCLHKYCHNCIELYNRKVKKECPECRHPIGSRRQLRSDYKINNIISALISDIDGFNQLEQLRREEKIRNYDFEANHDRMKYIRDHQNLKIEQEKQEKVVSKSKRKREEIREQNIEDNEQMNNQDDDGRFTNSMRSNLNFNESEYLRNKNVKQLFGVKRDLKHQQKSKSLRVIDDDILKDVNIEFIARQDIARTTDKIKVLQLKKFLLMKIDKGNLDQVDQ